MKNTDDKFILSRQYFFLDSNIMVLKIKLHILTHGTPPLNPIQNTSQHGKLNYRHKP